jgi:DNA polymerase-1
MLLRPAGTIRAVVVLESALDAILCHQEVPEDFAFVALGSTAYRPDEASDEVLRSAAHVLIAMDSDRAGAEAYYSLLERYPNASRLIVPPDLGKDVGEAFLQDMTVRDWCETGLEMAEQGTREVAAGGKRRGAAKRTVPAVEVTNTGLNIPYTLVVSPKQLKTALAELLEAECVAVDIETAPLPRFKADPKAALDPWRARPRLVQATNGGEIYIFDLDRVPLGDLAPLFRKGWVAHNAVFDYKHLLQAELDPEPAPPFCTMLCDNALMNQNRSLADLFEVHFGLALDKTLQDSDWSGGDLSEAQLQYAARDVAAVQRLWEKLRWEVTERRRNELAKLLHGAQRAVALMELNGIGFDAGAHTESVKAWRKEQGRALAALHELAGADLNPNSHAQLAAYLDTHLDEAARRDWPRTESGQLTTAAKEVAAFRGVPAVDLFLDYRHWADLVGKFGDKLSAQVNPVTGRLHPHFGIAGARTGRLSASNPNVQGLPHDPAFRRLFVPQPGHVLVRADYNQMQLRVAAILSGDARLLDAYERGLDVHRLTAASVLAKRPGDVTPEERSLAKAIAFGILFGIGPKALRGYALNKYGVRISVGEAAQVRNRFFETYPDVRRWQLAQAEEAQRTCCSVTPMGRVRNFAREDKDDFHTAAMNTPIQGGEGEVILAALALLPEALDPLDGLLVNCVHDEVLVECPESTATGVEAVLVDCMKRGMQHVFPAASLKGLVEVGHGPTWADAKGK